MHALTLTTLALGATSALALPQDLHYVKPRSAPFTLVALNASVPELHRRPILAYNDLLYVGRVSEHACPSCAAPKNLTLPSYVYDPNDATLRILGNPEKQVYIAPPSYVAYGTPPLKKSNVFVAKGFEYTRPKEEGGLGELKWPRPLIACPTGEEGVYSIKARLETPGMSYIGCSDIESVAVEKPTGGY